VGACLTVADSKRAFHQAFPHVIAPLYRRLVDELLVELHLLSHQKGFRADGLFAVGLTQVFDSLSRGYRPEEQKEPLFQALCSATGYEAGELRRQAAQAIEAVGHHSFDEVSGWLTNRGEGAPAPIAELLGQVQRSDFHYSRLVAVGLLSLLQRAQGADGLEPQALREAAHGIGEAMGLLKERVDKDLALYAANIEKLAQAVELMEETLAAERRRRQRQEEGASATPPAAEAAAPEAAPAGDTSAQAG
jgi:photosystem II biogenesis protein Psp29